MEWNWTASQWVGWNLWDKVSIPPLSLVCQRKGVLQTDRWAYGLHTQEHWEAWPTDPLYSLPCSLSFTAIPTNLLFNFITLRMVGQQYHLCFHKGWASVFNAKDVGKEAVKKDPLDTSNTWPDGHLEASGSFHPVRNLPKQKTSTRAFVSPSTFIISFFTIPCLIPVSHHLFFFAICSHLS